MEVEVGGNVRMKLKFKLKDCGALVVLVAPSFFVGQVFH